MQILYSTFEKTKMENMGHCTMFKLLHLLNKIMFYCYSFFCKRKQESVSNKHSLFQMVDLLPQFHPCNCFWRVFWWVDAGGPSALKDTSWCNGETNSFLRIQKENCMEDTRS